MVKILVVLSDTTINYKSSCWGSNLVSGLAFHPVTVWQETWSGNFKTKSAFVTQVEVFSVDDQQRLVREGGTERRPSDCLVDASPLRTTLMSEHTVLDFFLCHDCCGNETWCLKCDSMLQVLINMKVSPTQKTDSYWLWQDKVNMYFLVGVVDNWLLVLQPERTLIFLNDLLFSLCRPPIKCMETYFQWTS